ncbi:MAG: type II secretion system protein [Verrucomicrobia bacterium]|nr:type II secretion system protein [Verrucomicrobiota bacterium]MBT7065485.1 type II secretion system protein [Verrucomicrobiota bacterium]MBT7699369.1 type II secretion system protein [Verrucomicrobiota bacterium]
MDIGCSDAAQSRPIHRSGATGRYRQRQSGFTLIEVLLVVAIIGVMLTIMMPQMMSSMREHQLRGATRVVISAGRHAMSLAVLSQRRMNVVFDLDETVLTIRAADAPSTIDADGLGEADSPLDAVVADAWGGGAAAEMEALPADDDGAYEGAVAIVDEEVVHRLEGVAFSFIEVEGEDGYRAESGKHTIIYYTNGRCTPYTIGFEDDDGASATIEVDALASARVLER